MRLSLIVIMLFLCASLLAQKQTPYKTPNKAIVDLVDVPLAPKVSVSPNGSWMLQLGVSGFPSIQELAQPELRLAGLRINPETNGPSRTRTFDTLSLSDLNSGREFAISGMPKNPKVLNISWSPNSSKLAFTHIQPGGVELWVLDVVKKKAQKISDVHVNAALLKNPVQWADNGEWIVFAAISNERGQLPQKQEVPIGPDVRESRGEKAAVRTYQDLLKNTHDVALFEYYTIAQLSKVNLKGEVYPVGMPANFKSFSVSPNKEYILVKMIHQPYSYLVPYIRFPYKVEIWQSEGALWRELFNIPLAENIPKGIGAVRKGPRKIYWRNDKPSSIYWVKAMDDGDPYKKAVVRDHLFLFESPFEGEGVRSIAFQYRFDKIIWGKDNFAIAHEWWWDTRTEQVSSFNPQQGNADKQILFTFNWQDEYNHPGEFMTINGEHGRDVLFFTQKENDLLLWGKGATPEGYKPFVDRYSIGAKETLRLWQSNNPYYEYPLQLLQAGKKKVLTRRESKTDAPNYFVRNLDNGVVKQISNFQNPYPQMAKVKQQLIRFDRADGVQLSGKLYLPPGYSVGDSLLPVLMWAYPREHKSASTAGQLKESPNRFMRISWNSPLFWVMRGYAVFDNVAMPIVGEGDQEPNDTFTDQLVANAQAAVSALDSMGIADKNRIAIGGHSYGAFMTANLLAHSDLFAAGIARSGAYNRSLTPFGFQAEQRTFWEAKAIYMEMSPFSYADVINEPLLLIHGSADNNSGTFPLQSERFFTAIKGNGGKSRLLMLPYESHSYKAKESIYHMLWEMDRWLHIYVKNKK